MLTLGIDTSNYRTSAALFDSASGAVGDERRYLPVAEGSLGLRQSDAVFHHVKALPEILSRLFGGRPARPDAIGVTVSPRDAEDSYMPCFLVGRGAAESIGAVTGAPVYRFSHQACHVAAAAYSSGRPELLDREFIAFHVSGGTTEAVRVYPDARRVIGMETLARSLDLNAGQAIDRLGVALGLPFPAGAELDRLSLDSKKEYKIKPHMKDGCPSLSGLQNKCERMLSDGEAPCDVAAYCIRYVVACVEMMTRELEKKHPGLPVLYAGGVMSNTIARREIPIGREAVFADAAFSSDNALGVAYLAFLASERGL